MKYSFLQEISKALQGSLLPKNVGEDELTKFINESLKELPYYGPDKDKINLKKDIGMFGNDFKKATKESKEKFEPAL